MLTIKNNMMATNAARHLGKSYDTLSTSVERLSSGLRINSAKDDAAGLAVRELIRADVAVLQQGSRNAHDGISMLQTVEGAMGVIDDNLIRMKELAEQAATGSYSASQRSIMNAEFGEMAAEIDRISNSTEFNGISMLNSNTGSLAIHVGSTTTIDVDNVDMTRSGLGITSGTGGYQLLADTGTDDADTTWVTVGGAGQTVITTTFSDGGVAEDAIAITLTQAKGTYTMQEVADLINAQSQNLGNDSSGVSKNYSMASIVAGDGTNGRVAGELYLQLDSRLSGADAVTMTSDGSTDTTAVSGGITDAATAGHAAVSLTEAIDEGTADGGLFGTQAGSGISIDTSANALLALTAVTTAINTKDAARAAFGYKMNRLESTISVVDIQAENLMQAESRISDVDVATEMATLTRSQVLAQAGISMLSQANSMPQMALNLLR